jgi:hypothetical protein
MGVDQVGHAKVRDQAIQRGQFATGLPFNRADVFRFTHEYTSLAAHSVALVGFIAAMTGLVNFHNLIFTISTATTWNPYALHFEPVGWSPLSE